MTWLNWSLKLHVRLRTISHLIPTHDTHVYVKRMPYSFVWLYLIKCDVHTQAYVDQTQKDFWVFYLFLESVLFWKFLEKIHKFFYSAFWWLTRESWVFKAQSRVYPEWSTTLWWVRLKSRKTLRKFFKNLDFWLFGNSFSRLTRESRVHPKAFATH